MRIGEVIEATLGLVPGDSLTLTFDDRRKSRQRIVLDSGKAAALLLPRGTVLRQGDFLRADDGTIVAVNAAPETLSVAVTDDRLLLARVAYHLGNRHLPVEITATGLQYQHDHVLDAMVRRLGLAIRVQEGPFQPEGGAYGGGHGHDHDHDHDGVGGRHDHDHDHGAPAHLLAPPR
jgi:urease accessory protein